MANQKFPRSLVRKIEDTEQFPLRSLAAIHELREYLDQVEDDALCEARERGVSITEIAETIGMTRQSVYNKLKQLAEWSRQKEDETVVLKDLEARPGE